jgi:hypothetical protein
VCTEGCVDATDGWIRSFHRSSFTSLLRPVVVLSIGSLRSLVDVLVVPFGVEGQWVSCPPSRRSISAGSAHTVELVCVVTSSLHLCSLLPSLPLVLVPCGCHSTVVDGSVRSVDQSTRSPLLFILPLLLLSHCSSPVLPRVDLLHALHSVPHSNDSGEVSHPHTPTPVVNTAPRCQGHHTVITPSSPTFC